MNNGSVPLGITVDMYVAAAFGTAGSNASGGIVRMAAPSEYRQRSQQEQQRQYHQSLHGILRWGHPQLDANNMQWHQSATSLKAPRLLGNLPLAEAIVSLGIQLSLLIFTRLEK
jgi:hypothetical protein